ncbi:MAG: RNA polymerase subunit sigma-70 [Deltaproteobacteria bacterium]|nr:RNA polymerase subunit sigma-70 [Deltaproteobacteria bacterium]
MSTAETFLQALGEHHAIVAADLPIEALLSDLTRSCRGSWPGLPIDEDLFARHLARHMSVGAIDAEAFARIHGPDLYLACGCALGVGAAIAEFRRCYGPVIASSAGRLNREPWFVEETTQLLHQKLLVSSDGATPRIAEYSGRGPLEAWVRVAATRMAIDLRRKEAGSDSQDENLLDEVSAGVDPELDYIRLRHGDDFLAAFREAFSRLSSRERNVLRLHVLDGLDIGRIGAVYHVHRATVARWIARSRDTIVSECHKILIERLGATDSEVDSLVRFVRSHVQVNLVEVLTTGVDKVAESSR